MPLSLPLGLLAIVVIWCILIYNHLVRLRQHVREAWAGIDTELKRRYDLIPNLVETVKGYADHERETLQSVTDARTRALASLGPPQTQASDENLLVAALRRLFVVSERYPDLKASGNFLRLQRELANTEDRLQTARRLYNANVRDLNTRIEAFPSNLIAGLFRFVKAEFFEIEDTALRVAPQVALGSDAPAQPSTGHDVRKSGPADRQARE